MHPLHQLTAVAHHSPRCSRLRPTGFVRLRSRAWDKYVHADEDASDITLRPLGAAASLNVAWKVTLCPGEGDTVLLLQSAAHGRYLAVSSEDDDYAPPGHRGVRAVQRDHKSPHLEAPFRWLVEADHDQKYVRLHNGDRCLRCNGRPRSWNSSGKFVTVDIWNGNQATMMQWTVEAIPSTPEALPLAPQPQAPCKQGSCCACGREGSGSLCRRCAALFRAALVDIAREKLINERSQRHCYCFQCNEILTGVHSEHKDRSIPLGIYRNQFVAWAVGEEAWMSIFERIETQNRTVKPYPLYKSKWPRCIVCRDTVTTDSLYGLIKSSFCSLQCYVTGSGDKKITVESAIVAAEYSSDTLGFCLTCIRVVCLGKGQPHATHDWLRVRTDAGKLRVLVPHHHPKQKDWEMIKMKGETVKEVLIRDDMTGRCKECGTRLSLGNYCSVQCSLDATCREPRFLARPVQLRASLGAKIV